MQSIYWHKFGLFFVSHDVLGPLSAREGVIYSLTTLIVSKLLAIDFLRRAQYDRPGAAKAQYRWRSNDFIRPGQVPQSLFWAMERDSRLEDKERQQNIAGDDEFAEHSASLDSEFVKCVARNDSIFIQSFQSLDTI